MTKAKIIVALVLMLNPAGMRAQQYVISTLAGGAPPPTPAAGTNSTIGTPSDLTLDAAGNIYFPSLNCAFKLDTKGILNRLAGTSAAGYSGDGGPGINAKLSGPLGVALDPSGSLFIADSANARIRRVTAAGTITTVAGTGVSGFSGDGGPAFSAQLGSPGGIAFDTHGNLYILDVSRIRKVSADGVITTIAGTGIAGFSGDGGPAISAQIKAAKGLAIDRSGNLYFSDTSNQRIRKVSTDGKITTVAGNVTLAPGTPPGDLSGDGGPATQGALNLPSDVAVDGAGRLYIAEAIHIRVVSPDGILSTLVPATADPFYGVSSVAVDGSGNVYVADGSLRIRRIAADGTITTLAGPHGLLTALPNQPPTGVTFSGPSGVAADAAGNILIADTQNSWIWRISPGGAINFIGHANQPIGVGIDGAGNYYALEPGQITKANLAGSVPPTPFVVAGGGSSSADGVAATSAQVLFARGLAVDTAGNIFIADTTTNRVRKVSLSGVITTIAGTGTAGFSGDGGLASGARLRNPQGVAVDALGNIYIVDSSNFRIRKVSPDGVITTVAGGGTLPTPPPFPFPTGDGGSALSAILNFPRAVAVDAAGNIYIADENRIRKVSQNGIINTIAGNGNAGYCGDGGIATAATLNQPSGLAVDGAGNVYVADYSNNVVRVLRPTSAPVLISAVLDAATETATPVTPGKIVAVYGSAMGPDDLVANSPENGAFGPRVAGTSVTFNGIAAPMIYTSSGQLAAIVPYGIAGAAAVQVVVSSRNGTSTPFSVPVAASAPSLFSQNGTGAGQLAAVNLDGSLNDAAHPVRIGSYISLYGTGEGQTFPAGVDGALATTVYPKPLLPVTVTIGGITVEPVYAGAAPTEVLGLMQIVIQIPAAVKPGGYVPVDIKVGSGSTVSGAAWIAVAGN